MTNVAGDSTCLIDAIICYIKSCMSVYNRFHLLRYVLFIQSQGIDAREGMTIIGAQLITPSKYVSRVFYSALCNYFFSTHFLFKPTALSDFYSLCHMHRYTHTHTYPHSSSFLSLFYLSIKCFHGTKFYDSEESFNLASKINTHR